MRDYPDKNGITKSAICKAIIDADTVSMAHMHAEMIRERDDEDATDAMRFGTLAHMALLEPAEMLARVSVFDGDKRTKEWKTFKADHEGQLIVSRSDVERVRAMGEAMRADLIARQIIGQITHTEKPIAWRDEIYGQAYGRPDFVGSDMLGEFKTTGAISRRKFMFQCAAMGYDMGLAWYWHGLGRPNHVYMIAQESKPPFSVACYIVPATALETAYERARSIAIRYRACELSGVFPGPFAELMTFELPVWGANGETDMTTGTEEGEMDL
jgi:hypothetical protein